jgi:hypothetical protein
MTDDLLEMTNDLHDRLNEDEREAYTGATASQTKLQNQIRIAVAQNKPELQPYINLLQKRLHEVEIRIDGLIYYAKKKYSHGLEPHTAPPNACLSM